MHNKTLAELNLGLQAKKFSSVELTQFFLNRIDKHIQLNAYITVTPELALAQAKAADQRLAKRHVRSIDRDSHRTKRYFLYSRCRHDLWF